VGIGLHGGRTVRLNLRPAPANTGIVLHRTDVPDFHMRAGVDGVCDVDHATSIRHPDPDRKERLGTVEHLLSALYGLGVDNLHAEADSDEIPILDGSSAPFVYLIHEAGIREQAQPRPVFRLKERVEVRDGDRHIVAYPHEGLKITYFIHFDHPAIRTQNKSLEIQPAVYQEEIAPARTFGFLREVEAMRRAGLARGGSLDNAVVLGDHEILNAPLRYADEFVRHKILDLLGDISLLGMPLMGHVMAHKGGHGLHAALVRRILENPAVGEVVVPGVEVPLGPAPVLAPLSQRTLALARS
jgi:UDP-3-O-[3-hydroxymyristoyl] N-acetylglucosamine deacetylase